MGDTKLDAETQQDIDLENIRKNGYSNNLIIANEPDKGYTITEFIDERELGF